MVLLQLALIAPMIDGGNAATPCAHDLVCFRGLARRRLSATLRLRGGAADREEQLVIGIDGGTESIRAGIFRADGKLVGVAASPYATQFPEPGWAEQSPSEWWKCLGEAVRGAVAAAAAGEGAGNDESALSSVRDRVKALCVDTTCCTVVALDEQGDALRPALLWMDSRSAPQAARILQKCKGTGPLQVNCNGKGPISAEWMLPKSLWLKEEEPAVWDKAATICEYQDYLNLKLTGRLCASSCNAAARWHWDGEEAIKSGFQGRPWHVLQKLGMPELAEKWPAECLPMGARVGGLLPDAAAHLGLIEGLTVVQGGPDAFVGMLGLGATAPGQLALITGSSHLHLVCTSTPATARGVWGAYRGAPLPGLCFAEGGQSSTGSILRWARGLVGPGVSYAELDTEAADVPVGCEGLLALETFQGSRTPVTDPLQRGALVGLTLRHTRAHIWRALMEAVCLGTRACVEALAEAGHEAQEVLVAGGATRSTHWLQMHADATGLPVVVCECPDGPMLGCAVLAAAAAGLHDGDVHVAVKKMVRVKQRLEPSPAVKLLYDQVYAKYQQLAPALRPLEPFYVPMASASSSSPAPAAAGAACRTIIAPSLLASDWWDIKAAVTQCEAAAAASDGRLWLHIDMFDGVAVDSPHALTFGPQMVAAIRQRTNLLLDVHLVAKGPLRYVDALAAVAHRVHLQWESFADAEALIKVARALHGAGVAVGVCLAPQTQVQEIKGLLAQKNDSGAWLVELVNLLGVNTGFGGQKFQEHTLDKIREVRELLTLVRGEGKAEEGGGEGKEGQDVGRLGPSRAGGEQGGSWIMVDGGINAESARACAAAGADALVAGDCLSCFCCNAVRCVGGVRVHTHVHARLRVSVWHSWGFSLSSTRLRASDRDT